MTLNLKSPAKKPTSAVKVVARPSLPPVVPGSLEDRLRRIEAMGKRIEGYILFMVQMASLSGYSSEAKDQAAAAFHERMVAVEKELREIHEIFRLQ